LESIYFFLLSLGKEEDEKLMIVEFFLQISISEVLGCKEGCCATPNPKTEMMKAGCGSTDTTMDPILLRHFSLLQDIEALSQMLFHSCRGGEWASHYFLSEAATT
jgi:hypothetical protein